MKDIKITVTHIGIDYGKVEVQVKGFNPDEYEVPKALALALQKVLPEDDDGWMDYDEAVDNAISHGEDY